ncbi:MAG: 4-amino-4-deoxy-L-arabinose transferase, partial [Bryobacteraceae bacterium]
MIRSRFLKAFLLFSVSVLILTEILSLGAWLRFLPLSVAWLALASAAAVAAYRLPWPHPKLPPLLDCALLSGIVAIVGVVLFIGLVSPPNSTDAMAYHMPRVVYWAQQASVAFFPTPYLNQIMLQPMAEYLVLHTWVLTGGDRLGNLPQLLGFVFSLLGVSLVASAFGAGPRGQIITALFCATLPNGILQASGAKNDYLMTAYLLAIICKEAGLPDG